MIFLANLAVALAALLTVPLVGLIHGLRHPKDPQAGVAAILFFTLGTPRWLLLMLALGVGLGHGGFDWLAAERGAQVALVVLVHLLAGGASLAAQMIATERSGGLRPNLFLVAALLLPVATGLCALIGADAPPSHPRDVWMASLGAIVAATIVVVGLTLLGSYIADAPRRAENARQAAAAEEERNQEYYRERFKELEALPPDAPVYKFIQFTYCNEPGDIAPRARAMILARPNVLSDLAEALRGNACYEGMWFLATAMEQPPLELAEPARDAILRISAHIRDRLAKPPNYPDQHFGETARILEVVQKFAGAGVDFAPALRSLLETMSIPEAGDAEDSARAILQQWLDRHGAPAHAKA